MPISGSKDTLNLAWGTPPADLPVRPLVRRGSPGPVLADATPRRGALARTVRGRVSRYCLAHAYAPDLNPVEGIWSLLKRSMANLAASSSAS